MTAVGAFGILELQRRGFRPLEAVIAALVGVIVVAFAFQMFYAQPEADRILAGLFTPGFAGTDSVLLAAGILGATVMPHVIYLHSALTQRRVVGGTEEETGKDLPLRAGGRGDRHGHRRGDQRKHAHHGRRALQR